MLPGPRQPRARARVFGSERCDKVSIVVKTRAFAFQLGTRVVSKQQPGAIPSPERGLLSHFPLPWHRAAISVVPHSYTAKRGLNVSFLSAPAPEHPTSPCPLCGLPSLPVAEWDYLAS